MIAQRMLILWASCSLALPLAGAEPKPGDLLPGGPIHARTTQVDGVGYHVEIQFFKCVHHGQCYKSVGRDRAGRIYMGDSSQEANSFVYRFDPKIGRLQYVGDLVSSIRYGSRGGSDNAKIHSTFVEGPNGSIYFLSHGSEGGSVRHGGHLWRLDPRTDRITDLGIPLPGNTNFTLAGVDNTRDVIYTVSTPAGYLIRYDLKAATFTVIAETGIGEVRFLPMDDAGNVYLIAQGQIRRYSPVTGRLETIVQPDDDLNAERALGSISAFCWSNDRKRRYMLRYMKSTVFAWDVGSPAVEYLGRLHPDGADLYCSDLHIDAEGRRLYAMGATDGETNKGLYAFDLSRRKGYKLLAADEMIEQELDGKVRSRFVWIDFQGYGGVTGDDGTMYSGCWGGGRDKERDPNGRGIMALVAIRVKVKE